jgi:hypothetical protein
MDTEKQRGFVHITEVESCSDSICKNRTEGVSSDSKSWPLVPQELSTVDRAMDLYDAFLCALPSLLISKGVLCIVAWRIDRGTTGPDIDFVSYLSKFLCALNGQVRYSRSRSMPKLTGLQLLTAFTILFVTIMTTMVRRWALYKAQQGAYLVELEQLQASISLPSTLKMIWSFRRFSKLSFGLVFVWCFYYLGSQAQKLEYSLVNSRPTFEVKAAWPKNNISSTFSTANAAAIDRLNEKMIASIVFGPQSLKQRRAYDLFGNSLIPIIEDIPNFNETAVSNVENPDEQAWAAYSGSPIYLLDELNGSIQYDNAQQYLGNWDFSTSYFLIQCGRPQFQPFEAFPNGTLPGAQTSINMTNNDRKINSEGKPTLPRQFELWGRWDMAHDTTFANPNGSMVLLCNLTQSFIDVSSTCGPQGCLAKQVQYTEPFDSTSPVTSFDDDDSAILFLDNLLRSTGAPKTNQTGIVADNTIISTTIELYPMLMLPYANGSSSTFDQENTDYCAKSLTALLNTYYIASQAVDCTHDFGDDPVTQYNPQCVYKTLHGAIYDPQYYLSIPWLVIDFISCIILFRVAWFSWMLRRVTLAPDILGYVSSLTRENPHFDLPTGDGSTLPGIERAKIFGDVKIKIGDVAGSSSEQGRVGISHAVDGYEAAKLEKNRKYA